jgi:predicted lipid-binding transport protein (Tim44 family)
MKKWLLVVCVAVFGGMFLAVEAEARRLGGGRALGTQRSVTPPPAAPAGKATQAAPQQAPGQQPAAAAPAGSRWGGILGGLALGGLLGYMFGGEGLMGFLLLAGLALFAAMAIAVLLRGRVAQPAAAAAGGNMNLRMPAEAPMSVASRFPAGFDAEGFLRGARMNFVKLQLANDRGDLEEIREFTTPELFEALQAEVLARAGRQQTDIAGLEAQVLDVATENGRHWVSVAFSGAEPEPFTEVWNLTKPVDGTSGWLLAGIQQMH